METTAKNDVMYLEAESAGQGVYDIEQTELLEQQRRAEAWNEGGWRYVGWGWDEDHLNRVVYVYLYWYHPTTNQWAQLGFGALGTKNYDWSIEDEYKRLKECLRYVGRADYLDAFPEYGHNGMVTQFRGGEGHPGDFHPYQEGTPDEPWMRYAFFDEGY